jgi:hypothetical protein
LQAEAQKRSNENNSRQDCDGHERRADGHSSDDVRRDEQFETEQDRAADLLSKAAVHLALAPPEPTRGHDNGQPDTARDHDHAADVDAPTDRFDDLVEGH